MKNDSEMMGGKRSRGREIWALFKRNKPAMVGLALFVLIILVAVFADVSIRSAQTTWDATCLPVLSTAAATPLSSALPPQCCHWLLVHSLAPPVAILAAGWTMWLCDYLM